MENNPHRYMVLMIDFDGDEDRVGKLVTAIPAHLRERVFILGALDEPEDLKPHLGSYEKIGRHLASECRDQTTRVWEHQLLLHNKNELERLRVVVRGMLFA